MKSQIEAAMAELVDLLAANPETEIDPRAWSQLMVYSPQTAWIEIIYGSLWLMPVNMDTQAGMAAHLARKVALDMITKEGQARGIEVAKRAVRGNMLKWASTQASAEINHTPRAG